MSKELYDLSILSDMVYGDTDFMAELVNTFIEYAPLDSQELLSFAEANDWVETSKKAHKLKSSIRTLGVTSLSDLILEIELDAKDEKNTTTIQPRILEFKATLSKVLESLQNEPFITSNNE